MQETLGIFFIALSAVILVGVGLYAMAPMLMPRRTIVARQTVLGAAGHREDLLKAVNQNAIDKGMVEELFAELYSVRTALAELAAKTKSTEEQTEASPEAANASPEERDWYAVDQGAIDELFSELFSIRSAVASLSGEVRSLRESVAAAETPRRRTARKAA